MTPRPGDEVLVRGVVANVDDGREGGQPVVHVEVTDPNGQRGSEVTAVPCRVEDVAPYRYAPAPAPAG